MTRRAYRPKRVTVAGVKYVLTWTGKDRATVYRDTGRGLRRAGPVEILQVQEAIRREAREKAERAQVVEALAGPAEGEPGGEA